ncbi:DNA endonuclease RBBP8 [Diretmus argenteus]
MSSPASISISIKPADLFEDVWCQLKECHQKALQELEAKVSRLKKERCLDAQKLEEFYSRNQQLKEQQKTLQDTVGLLEERLRDGACDRCVVLEENMKHNQSQNLRLIAKLKNKRNVLEDENRKLNAELERLKTSYSELRQTSFPEHEDGVIPDSPIQASSLVGLNKLKRHKHNNKTQHVRYAETPLPPSHSSLFNELHEEPPEASGNHGTADVLVPNTCEMDASQTSDVVGLNLEAMVAETCRLDVPDRPRTEPTGLQNDPDSPRRFKVHLRPQHCASPSSSSSTLIHHPDSTTDRSPSLLVPSIKRVSGDSCLHKAKRKKESGEEAPGEEETLVQEGEEEPVKRSSAPFSGQHTRKETPDHKVRSMLNGANGSFVRPAAVKRTNGKEDKEVDGRLVENRGDVKKRSPPPSASRGPSAPDDPEIKTFQDGGSTIVDAMWSVDPAAALSLYDTTSWAAEEERQQSLAEPVDTDCTFVSHSILQRQVGNDQEGVSGRCEKANDSLDKMFDATAHGEYCSQADQTRHCDDDEEEEEEEDELVSAENTSVHSNEHKARNRTPTFAHIAVVRKKDERRKLKGSTCKECEIYYEHLPEDERQKKLSACSRHRFRYIPPCTPENFWEVGFPSTQTCIERGYIREENTPQARQRRRQPFNALFSPKRKEPET